MNRKTQRKEAIRRGVNKETFDTLSYPLEEIRLVHLKGAWQSSRRVEIINKYTRVYTSCMFRAMSIIETHPNTSDLSKQ